MRFCLTPHTNTYTNTQIHLLRQESKGKKRKQVEGSASKAKSGRKDREEEEDIEDADSPHMSPIKGYG